MRSVTLFLGVKLLEYLNQTKLSDESIESIAIFLLVLFLMDLSDVVTRWIK